MRGYPPIHLLLLAVAFALVAVPLANLTSGERAVGVGREEEVAAEGEQVRARLKLRFTPGLESASLTVGGRDLLVGVEWRESPTEVEVEMPMGEAGQEMMLEARWLEGGEEAALTVEVEPESLPAKELTQWASDGEISEVLFFEW